MTLTQNWTSKDYLNHITKNKLDQIWYSYCNPKNIGFEKIDGIRLSAYTPIYTDFNVEMLERKCSRKGCDGNLVVPLDDRLRRVIYKIVCNGTVNGGSSCGAYKMILWRWVSGKDRTKLWFKDGGVIRYYGKVGRAFYATLSLYDRRILSKKEMYVNESLMRAHTLGIDIDIKGMKGTICDIENRIEIDKVLEIIKEQLETFCRESWSLQTSGNGVYLLIHHNLVKVDIFNQMGRFNSWLNYLNKVIKSYGIRRIKVDPINMPSRVFKLIGSIHQKYDLVCIPLLIDCKLSEMNSGEFKLKNFDINKYIVDGKLKFYNRYDGNEKKSLYEFLEEHSEKHMYGDLRAIRYGFKESVSAITCEEQEDIKEKAESDNFEQHYTGWVPVKVDVPGRVIHKKTKDGRHQIEMLGVFDKKDIEKILDYIYKE